jgi:hypothetical protein
MRKLTFMIAAFVAVLAVCAMLSPLQAQPGGKKDKGDKGGKAESVEEFVNRMMAFNKAKDGKLTKKELFDTRLHELFDRADTNKDGVVTREELEALYAKEFASGGQDKGGKGDKGKGDKGFKGKGPSQPGVVLAPFVQDALKLTDEQRKQVADLQKDVDTRLRKILTEEQRTRLLEMSQGPVFGEKKGPPDKKAPPTDK